MKKWVMMSMAVLWAAGLQAAIIASDDFSGGTAGNFIDNVAVQTGTGTWTTNYTAGGGGLNPLKYATGGYAVPGIPGGGSAVVSNNAFSSVTSILKVSADFSARNDSADAGSWTMGFYETISKGYLVNETLDDFVAFRFILSGANQGKFAWRVYDEGVSQTTALAGTTTAFDATDVIRLSLSYDFTTGDITATASNVTANSLINTATLNYTTLSGFKYAGICFSGFSADTTDPTRVTNFVVETIPEPATIGMLGLGVLATLVVRRIRA